MNVKPMISVLPVCFLLACGQSQHDANTQDDVRRVDAMQLLTEKLGKFSRTDPVAADAVGLRIIQAKRQAVFGEERPLQPTAHYIALADSVYHLGQAADSGIELVRLDWQEGALI